MTDEQVLTIIEKMGPEAAGALDSWLSLQWTKFWMLDVLAPMCVAMIVFAMVFIIFYLPNSNTESEEK